MRVMWVAGKAMRSASKGNCLHQDVMDGMASHHL